MNCFRILFLCLFIFNSSYAIDFTKEEQRFISKKKFITMCIDPDWMPYEKIKKGKHIGMSYDYMRFFEKKIGIKIQMVPTVTWAQSVEYAKQRKCDIFSLAMQTPSRLKYMNFTKAYVSYPVVVATSIEKPFVLNGEEIIEDKMLGIVKGYAIGETLRKRYPLNRIVDVNSVNDGLQKVKDGELYGFIGSVAAVGYSIEKNYSEDLKIGGRFYEEWALSIGVRNDMPILVHIFEKAIDTISDERRREILNKWVAVEY